MGTTSRFHQFDKGEGMPRKVVATTETDGYGNPIVSTADSETIENTAADIVDVATSAVDELNLASEPAINPSPDTDEDEEDDDEDEDEDDDEEEEEDEEEDEDEDDDEEENGETTPAVRHRGRPSKVTIDEDELKARLEPEVLSLVATSQKRDWRSERANDEEKKAIVVAGHKIEALGANTAEVAKMFGLSYLTYTNWKKAMLGEDTTPKRRGRKPKDEPTPTMYRGEIAQPREHSFTLSQSVMQMIIRENQSAVLDIMLLGKSEGIKDAIKLLLQA